MTYDQILRERDSQYANEHHDCVVRAFAVATDMPYSAVHRTFEQHGRQLGRGVKTEMFINTKLHGKFANYDLLWVQTAQRPRTLNRLIHDARYKTGRYLVRTRGHLQAFVDGTLYDAAGYANRARITGMWELRAR